jgi:methylmalonyl-CoA mutase N-terminal domain/subunit
MGGAVAAIESRFMQRAIERAAYAEQLEIESGARPIVGLNRHADGVAGGGLALQGELFRLDAAAAEAQCRALEVVRAERDADRARAALDGLRAAAARDAADLMPPILAAVRVYATVGEISDTLRSVFGTHRERF